MSAALAGSEPEEERPWELQCWGSVEVMTAEDRQRWVIGQGCFLPG